jgi:hypothetical protein
MTYEEQLQGMCLYHTLLFGEWQTAGVARRIEMVKSLSVMYLEIRKGSYRQTEPWVQEAIDGLYPEFAGMIEQRLPAAARREINNWMQTLLTQDAPF